jgi:uncharacterized protein YbjT (DUF2867 family)
MKILVAGATGTVGSNLVEQLLQAGHQVRALTRNPAKANLPAGAELIAGDLINPSSFAAALEGVDALHLINFGGDDFAPLQTGGEIMALAKQAGVKRVTVLMGGMEGAVEQAVKDSGLEWTFLQPVEFMSNMREWASAIRSEKALRLPFVDRKTAIVHEADIAAVAAAALTQEGHAGKTYPITGSEVLSPRKMVDIISQAIGSPIQLIELTEAQAIEQWKAAGMPEDTIQFMLWVYGNPPEVGYTVAPTVQQVIGRPPRTFAQWATANRNLFSA